MSTSGFLGMQPINQPNKKLKFPAQKLILLSRALISSNKGTNSDHFLVKNWLGCMPERPKRPSIKVRYMAIPAQYREIENTILDLIKSKII